MPSDVSIGSERRNPLRIEGAQRTHEVVTATDAVEFAGWILDFERRQLKADAGETVQLTHAECRILILLADNPHQAITRHALMKTAVCRGWSWPDRSIDVHISNLRRKLGAVPQQPSLIRTVRGVGYMFAPASVSPAA